jgi:hypothetical protein
VPDQPASADPMTRTPRPRREPVIVRPAPDHPWRQTYRGPDGNRTLQSPQPRGGQGNAGERPERRATATQQTAPASRPGPQPAGGPMRQTQSANSPQ